MAVSLELIAAARAKAQSIQKESFKSPFFRPRDIAAGESVDLKVLSPVDGQDFPATMLEISTGEGKQYRNYISQNFPFEDNGSCKLCELLADAEATTGVENASLLAKIIKRKAMVVPVLVCKVKLDTSGAVSSVSVLDNEPKLLCLSPKQADAFLELFTKRGTATADKQGLFSYTQGKTIELTRKGEGKNNTSYTFALAGGEPLELPTALNQPVDVYALVRKQILSDEKLTEAVTAYFS